MLSPLRPDDILQPEVSTDTPQRACKIQGVPLGSPWNMYFGEV